MEIHMPVTRIAEPNTGMIPSGTEDQQVIRLQFIRNPLLDYLPGAVQNVQKIMLGHLSKQNNTPELAYETTHSAFTVHGARSGSDYLLGVAGDNGKVISF